LSHAASLKSLWKAEHQSPARVCKLDGLDGNATQSRQQIEWNTYQNTCSLF
jgi:hypothetical protein